MIQPGGRLIVQFQHARSWDDISQKLEASA